MKKALVAHSCKDSLHRLGWACVQEQLAQVSFMTREGRRYPGHFLTSEKKVLK